MTEKKLKLRTKLFRAFFLGVSFIDFLQGKGMSIKALGLDLLQFAVYSLIIFLEYLYLTHLIATAHRLPPVVAHCIGL